MATANGITQLAAQLAQLARTLAEQSHEPTTPQHPPHSTSERVLLTAEEAAERLGIGRTFMFKLIRTGEIESVQIGRLRRVPASEIQEYANRLIKGTPASKAA
jgi:excisionase family DNA binding protein